MMRADQSRRRRRRHRLAPSSAAMTASSTTNKNWARLFPLSSLVIVSQSTAAGHRGETTPAFFLPVLHSRDVQRDVEWSPQLMLLRGRMRDCYSPSSIPICRSPLSKQLHRDTQALGMVASSNGDSDETDDRDGLYLDEETYLQAEETMLRSDGSLNFGNEGEGRRGSHAVPKRMNKAYRTAAEGLFSPPPSYSYYDDGGNDEENTPKSQPQQQSNAKRQRLSEEEQLYQSVMDIENGQTPRQDAETLHAQIFAEEEAYLKQSEEFRESLSALHDEETESPMARERRDIIERYNEDVLEKLVAELEEMEKMSLSREEAMERGSTSDGAVFCSKCGLRVTPDVIEQAETMEIFARDGGGGSEVQKKSGGRFVCRACHLQELKTDEEAKVRLGAGSYYDGYASSSSIMFDRKKAWQPKPNDGNSGQYRDRKRRTNYGGDGRNRGGRGSGNVRGIDTSSLFQVPTGYDNMNKEKDNAASRNAPIESIGPGVSSTSSGDGQRPEMPPDRRRTRSSRVVGGRELARRMQQQQPEGGAASSYVELEEQLSKRTIRSLESSKQPRKEITKQRQNKTRDKQVNTTESTSSSSSEPSKTGKNGDQAAKPPVTTSTTPSAGDSWVKVEDPGSKQMFYWNTETGEMKKTLD